MPIKSLYVVKSYSSLVFIRLFYRHLGLDVVSVSFKPLYQTSQPSNHSAGECFMGNVVWRPCSSPHIPEKEKLSFWLAVKSTSGHARLFAERHMFLYCNASSIQHPNNSFNWIQIAKLSRTSTGLALVGTGDPSWASPHLRDQAFYKIYDPREPNILWCY